MAKRYGTTGEIVGKRVLLDKSTPKKPEAVKRLGKVRHCVFPKHYDYNHNEPPYYAFEKDADGTGM